MASSSFRSLRLSPAFALAWLTPALLTAATCVSLVCVAGPAAASQSGIDTSSLWHSVVTYDASGVPSAHFVGFQRREEDPRRGERVSW
jgi:hypothetical protein